MIKLILSLFNACLVIGVQAQGTVNFNNRVPAAGISAPILKPDGTGVSGTEGFAALYGGPSPDSMQLLGSPVNFRTGAAAGYVVATDTVRVVPGVPGGQYGFFQLKAWLGPLTSYEAAVAAGFPAAVSQIFSAKTGGIIDPGTGLPSTPTDLIGLGLLIPEPSTFALAGLGAVAMFLRRRR